MPAYSAHFTIRELSCRCCESPGMTMEALSHIENIRTDYYKCSMSLTSAYRCTKSDMAARGKTTTGRHNMGVAIDVAVRGKNAFDLIVAVQNYARTNKLKVGLGINSKDGFVHIDFDQNRKNSTIWSY